MSRKGRPYEHWGREKKLAFIRSLKRKTPYGEHALHDYAPASLIGEPNPEPITCAHFGCGRILSRQEQLFGRRCIHHSGTRNHSTLWKLIL